MRPTTERQYRSSKFSLPYQSLIANKIPGKTKWEPQLPNRAAVGIACVAAEARGEF
jgi:hypothetical protein